MLFFKLSQELKESKKNLYKDVDKLHKRYLNGEHGDKADIDVM